MDEVFDCKREGGSMIIRKSLQLAAILSLGIIPVSVAAQPSMPGVENQVIDPARLEAAEAFLETIMPKENRSAMIGSMVRPMMQNLVAGIQNAPDLQEAFADDPELQKIFARFVEKQTERSMDKLNAGLPDMMVAMKRAYARQFSLKELSDAKVFFATSSGKAYMSKAGSIMADPDVAKWQQELMATSMQELPAQMKEFMDEVKTHIQETKGAGKRNSSKKRSI
jgi:hypothetical protein